MKHNQQNMVRSIQLGLSRCDMSETNGSFKCEGFPCEEARLYYVNCAKLWDLLYGVVQTFDLEMKFKSNQKELC